LDSKLKPRSGRLDGITKNEFDHPKFDSNASILVLMLHKFDANTSNFVLMPKKTGGRGHYNFIFS
jgi:hypothetical protein